MQSLRDYIMGISAAAMICGITLGLAGSSKMQPLLKLVCGIVLTLAAVRPVLSISGERFQRICVEYEQEAENACQEGTRLARQQREQCIIESTRTYILDKARELGLDVQVQVALDQQEPPVPECVWIQGKLDFSTQRALSRILTEELGISQENQIWNG